MAKMYRIILECNHEIHAAAGSGTANKVIDAPPGKLHQVRMYCMECRANKRVIEMI
jgi:methylthioribose-1-phosphate isomerase